MDINKLAHKTRKLLVNQADLINYINIIVIIHGFGMVVVYHTFADSPGWVRFLMTYGLIALSCGAVKQRVLKLPTAPKGE